MIIEKNDELVNLLKNLLPSSRTPSCSSVISKVGFHNKGITFYLTERIETVTYFCDSVDIPACYVANSFFVSLLLSEIERKGKAEIKYSESPKKSVVVNDEYVFNITESASSIYRGEEDVTADIRFSKEQISALYKDFVYTIGDYFTNPKTTDVIAIAIKEGTVYKLLPGIHTYSISKFDAVIDDAHVARRYGHSKSIFLLPRKLFDLIIGDEVKIQLGDEYVTIKTNKVEICYQFVEFGTKAFTKFIAYYGTTPAESSIALSSLKNLGIKDFVDNGFESEEDKNIQITIENDKAKISIENCTFTKDIKEKNFKISTNMSCLSFLIETCSESATIEEVETEDENFYLIHDGEKIIFIPKTNYFESDNN